MLPETSVISVAVVLQVWQLNLLLLLCQVPQEAQ